MPIAPVQRPVAALKYAVPVACFERPPGRRWDGPGGMAELVFELAAPGKANDRRVAGKALHRCRRDGAAALDLARRRPRNAGQSLEAGPYDQLRSRPGAIALAAPALPAELDQRVVLPLAVAALVVLHRLHKRLSRAAHLDATFGIEQAVDPHHPVLRLAQVQVSPRMRSVGLVDGALGIDPVLEILGHAGELAGVHGLWRP